MATEYGLAAVGTGPPDAHRADQPLTLNYVAQHSLELPKSY